MNKYYVTFSVNTFFKNYYQEIHAESEEIVTAFMRKNYPKVWSNVYTVKPEGLPLQQNPEMLWYQSPEHI